jgi:hypothetical protein
MPARLDESGARAWREHEREREGEQSGGRSGLRSGGEIVEDDPSPEDLVHGGAP